MGEEVRHDDMKSLVHDMQPDLLIDEPHMLSNVDGVRGNREVGLTIPLPPPDSWRL